MTNNDDTLIILVVVQPFNSQDLIVNFPLYLIYIYL